MKHIPKTDISSQLFEQLKTLTNRKRFKTLFQISEYLKEEKNDIIIFDYIGIISYTENTLAYDSFKDLKIPKFGEEMNKLQDDIFTFFINCVKSKKEIDNNYVSSGVLQILDRVPLNSTMRKYFTMVEPLIKNKASEDRAKIKLLILNPINFERLYKEISSDYFSFPSSVKDFYSYGNLGTNTSNIKNFVEKQKNNGMDKILNDLKKEFSAMKQENKEIKDSLNKTKDRLNKVEAENKEIKDRLNKTKDRLNKVEAENKETKDRLNKVEAENKETKDSLNKTKDSLNKVKAKLIEKENDIENLKDDLYKINLRDSIKDFIDDLLWTFNIYIENANISTKINEIKKKINIIIMGLQSKEKKYAILLMNFLDFLYDKLQKGNDLSHYFNNIGFKKENLPDKIKQKFSEYSNGDKRYNYASLVLASYDSDKIHENDKYILNKVIKTIIGFDKKDGTKRIKDIVNCFKVYSEY